MTKKKKAEAEELFTAELEMTRIVESGVRYRVIKPKGINVLNLHHLEIAREDFPRDDDFSMNFMGLDLDKIGAYTEDEAERMTDEEKKTVQKTFEALKEKQAEFRKFQRFELVIRR